MPLLLNMLIKITIAAIVAVAFFHSKTPLILNNADRNAAFQLNEAERIDAPFSNITVYKRWDENNISWDDWFKRGYVLIFSFLASAVGIILLALFNNFRLRKLVKKNFQEIWEAEENYYRLLEIVSDAIIIADAISGKILEVNQKAEALTGHMRVDLLDMNVFSLMLKSEENMNKALFKTIQEEGFIRNAELNLLNKEKRMIKVIAKGRFIKGYKKTVILLTLSEKQPCN